MTWYAQVTRMARAAQSSASPAGDSLLRQKTTPIRRQVLAAALASTSNATASSSAFRSLHNVTLLKNKFEKMIESNLARVTSSGASARSD